MKKVVSLGRKEGDILNQWFYNRMVRKNQNVLLAVTGSTGSGKSYACLSIADHWYISYFKEAFPVETNCCFSIGEVLKLLSGKKLRKYEIIILEEGGVNLGNLDFQSRVSKLFSHVLQSFRSMNIILIMNLPVLTMLNKSARLLLHAHFITAGINYQRKRSQLKPFLHQLNQSTGKSFWKYIRVGTHGSFVPIKRLTFSIPSDELLEIYESKKLRFVSDLTESFSKELDELDKETQRKLGRKNLSEKQQEVFDMLLKGLTPKEIAEEKRTSIRNIHQIIEIIRRKGYGIKNTKKSLRKAGLEVPKPIQEAV